MPAGFAIACAKPCILQELVKHKHVTGIAWEAERFLAEPPSRRQGKIFKTECAQLTGKNIANKKAAGT